MVTGATLYLAGRRVEPLETLAAKLGASAHVLPIDVTDSTAIAEALSVIEADRGRLDMRVNNAHYGRTGNSKPPAPTIMPTPYRFGPIIR